MLQCSAVMISHDNFKSSCHTRTSFYYRMYVDVSLQVTVLWVLFLNLLLSWGAIYFKVKFKNEFELVLQRQRSKWPVVPLE